MIARIIRRMLIAAGLAVMCIEAYFSAKGGFKTNKELDYAIIMASLGVISIVIEAISMHFSVLFRQWKQPTNAAIALGVWASFTAIGFYFTVTGAQVRQESNTSTRVAGFVKYATQEATEKELTRDIGLLTDQVAALQSATISDGGAVRKVRPLKQIEGDGRFIKSDRCSADEEAKKKWTAGQRTVCQEYASADDLAKKEAELKDKRGKLDAAREKLTSTDVVLSRNTEDATFLTDAGMTPQQASKTVSLFIGFVLHLSTALIWFAVPKYADLSRAHVAEPDKWTPNFHVTVNTPPQAAQFMPAAPALALPPGHRTFDPGKQRALVAQFWAAALPGLPKVRQRVVQHLADFDRICARENVETPSGDVFCVLSAEHLPNVEHLGGAYWFTPAA